MTTIIEHGRFDLPGFTLPLNFRPVHPEPLPSALDPREGRSVLPVTTNREFDMLRLMNTITDKPDWEMKVFDDTIVAKWRSEVSSSDYSPAMLDWVIAELRYKTKSFKESGAISIYNGDVVKSDTAIPRDLKETLKKAVLPLENIPERYKDYHPGSDGKVLDLVHPSLFPLIYGRSRILPDSLVGLEDCVKMTGNGQPIPIPSEDQVKPRAQSRYDAASTYFSRNFQWLPCEVALSTGDERVKITSYINNLHPKMHQELYGIIEQIISKTIPLWNMTLAPINGSYESKERITFSGPHYDPDPEDMNEEDKPPRGSNESEDDYYDRLWEWESDFKVEHLVQPEPGTFKEPEVVEKPVEFDLRKEYGNKGLQIIVKLASIQVTPEKPAYEGGSWHVEGQLNEHICATAIYYYDNDNITESYLGFRQHSNEDDLTDVSYAQNDHAWLGPIFGLEQEEPLVQEVGNVICKEGRLLTFPNILQHCVSPFELEDKSKPGYRKILALFLVDPAYRIISTANVPPQQRDWWQEVVLSTGAFDSLATELQDKMFQKVDDFPIGMEEAKEIRLKLMEERKDFVVKQDRDFHDFTISLCEH